MDVREATSEAEIRECYPVMHQLRGHVDEDEYLERVQRQRKDGYRLVYVEDEGEPVAVAGFRLLDMLSRGRFLYVDDLVTAERARGEGYGTRLVEWLVERAREEGCQTIDLDSGFQRKRAHRFYLERGFELAALHFRRELE